jgi:hypothetical protein
MEFKRPILCPKYDKLCPAPVLSCSGMCVDTSPLERINCHLRTTFSAERCHFVASQAAVPACLITALYSVFVHRACGFVPAPVFSSQVVALRLPVAGGPARSAHRALPPDRLGHPGATKEPWIAWELGAAWLARRGRPACRGGRAVAGRMPSPGASPMLDRVRAPEALSHGRRKTKRQAKLACLFLVAGGVGMGFTCQS